MRRIIVCGGRDFDDYNYLKECLDVILAEVGPDVVIVCGKAAGADTLGERYGKEHDLPVDCYPAEWDRYGKSAGFRRNVVMLDNADMVVAFWDGKSKGTAHTIAHGRNKGLDVRVFPYGGV